MIFWRCIQGFLILLVLAGPGTSVLGQRVIRPEAVAPSSDTLTYFKVETVLPGEMLVVVDRNYEQVHTMNSGDSIMVEPGVRHIRIATDTYVDAVFLAPAEPGTILIYRMRYRDPRNPSALREPPDWPDYVAGSSYPPLKDGVTLGVASDLETQIYVDDVLVGTGMARVQAEPGLHDIRLVHPQAGVRHERVQVPRDPPRLVEKTVYVRPAKTASLVQSVLPGATQIYQRQTVKGVAFAVTVTATTVLALSQHYAFRSENDTYNALRRGYQAAQDESVALRIGNDAEAQYDMVQRVARRRDVLIGIAVGAYLVNLIDAWIPPRGGYRTPGGYTLRFDAVPARRGAGVRMAVTF